MAFELDIGFVCVAGRKDVNEDFCAAMLPEPGHEARGCIVAIADGVSTGGMGQEAAQTTVTSLVRDYYGTPDTWETTVALDRIIAAQHSWLAGVNQRRRPRLGLTTLTALVLRGQSYALAHVGDTRAYLLRDGDMTRLTTDHVADHPDLRHKLRRCVGADNTLVVDYLQGDLQVGDVFMLLSDGVHHILPEKRLRAMLAMARLAAVPAAGSGKTLDAVPPVDAETLCKQLVDAAMQAGSRDNMTAMVVRVLGLLEADLQDENRRAFALAIPPRLDVGDLLDGFTVTAPVADDGVKVLYQVRDPQTQKLYLLKTLRPARAHDPAERAMLAHEAWLAKRMQSSQGADFFVRLHDHLGGGLQPSAFYLLYDWPAGETLQQLLERKHKFGPPQVLAIAVQVSRALSCLHRQGVIHRDIKPANLHHGQDGILRILDLGVALSGREPTTVRSLHTGAAGFINPEQWGFSLKPGRSGHGAPLELPDKQSDLFALGVTLYQLLTGKLPYGDVSPCHMGRYLHDPLAPSRCNPEVPIWLDQVVLKAISRDKRRRFETAEEFLLALERGASRPVTVAPATALIQREPKARWKMAFAVSMLLNVLLVYWLLFLLK